MHTHQTQSAQIFMDVDHVSDREMGRWAYDKILPSFLRNGILTPRRSPTFAMPSSKWGC